MLILGLMPTFLPPKKKSKHHTQYACFLCFCLFVCFFPLWYFGFGLVLLGGKIFLTYLEKNLAGESVRVYLSKVYLYEKDLNFTHSFISVFCILLQLGRELKRKNQSNASSKW